MSSERSLTRKLPSELLSEILLCVAHADHEDLFALHFARSLFRLAHVCSDWRQIALSTPCLWSFIRIDSCEGPNFKGIPIEMLREWLRRSGNRHLSILFEHEEHVANVDSGMEPGGHDLEITVAQMVEETIFHSQRWLSFRSGHSLPLKDIQRIFQVIGAGDALQLESLQEYTIAMSDESTVIPFDFDDVPRLRVLNLRNIDTTVECRSSTPLRQITLQATNHATVMVDLPSLLSSCPSLEDLFLDIPSHQGPIITDIIRPPALTNLRFSQLPFEQWLLLDYLFTPKLKDLCIDFPWLRLDPQITRWPHIASLLTHSATNLTSLELSNIPMNDTDFIACIRQSPHLESLEVTDMPITQAALLSLMRASPGSPYEGVACLDSLKSLSFFICLGMPFEILCAVILSWWQPWNSDSSIEPLQVSLLDCFLEMEPFLDVPEIQACVEGGEYLDVRNGPW